MKKITLTGAIAFLFICSFFSPVTYAGSMADKYLGKKLSCLNTINISESYILDDQTILFKTDNEVVYINRLPLPCYGLKIAGSYSYGTSINKLCKLDIIKILEDDYGTTSSCGLGEFIAMKGPKSIRAAVKILKEGGILKSLVLEGAFKKTFPIKSSSN